MNSQIYDSYDDGDKREGLSEAASNRIAELESARTLNAERRRALAEPTHKVVVANPTSMHHKITLGGVLVNECFQASDADTLAGLLSLDGSDFADRFTSELRSNPSARAGEIIGNMIDADTRTLSALGLYAEWERRLAIYLEDRSEWLARDEQFRLEGAWREGAMTVDQRWLIRVTCRALAIAMPGHLLRGQAADWLESHGANLNYVDFV